nr:PREDICTED: histone H2A.Z-specific chaperone CHZ1-like [Anolis carolinensis]|eukprot:XP_008116795.1 PREDICTED: histone H2A.Z-specific chaperone CHZ1-like [Anolis carolinensis]
MTCPPLLSETSGLTQCFLLFSAGKSKSKKGSLDKASGGSSEEEEDEDDDEGEYEVQDDDEEEEENWSDSDGEGDGGAKPKGARKRLSAAELRQLAQGPEDVVEELNFSDEEGD